MQYQARQPNQYAPPLAEDNGWRGFASHPDPALLPAGLASVIENKRCNGGRCETRLGAAALPWLNQINPTAAWPGNLVIEPWGELHGAAEFADPAGVNWILLAADGGVWRCAENNAPTAVPLPAGVELRGRVFLRQAFNEVFLFRLGINAPPLRMQAFATGFTHLLPDWEVDETYVGPAEVKWGPWLDVDAVDYDAGTGTAEITTDGEHGLADGQDVVFRTGADEETVVHGRYTVTVLDAQSVQITTGATDPSAWGQVSPMTDFWAVKFTDPNYETPTLGTEPQNELTEWTRLATILPGGVDAVYMSNRLVVATAYNPGGLGYTGKAEFLLCSDVLDPIHTGGILATIRSNTGGGDEIVALAKLAENQVLILKERSSALLTGVANPASAGEIEGIVHTTLDATQGCAGRQAWALCGTDVRYLSPKRGIAGVGLTQQSKVQGINEPFTTDVQDIFTRRLNPLAAAGASFAWWNSRLYAALPLDGHEFNSAVLVYNFLNQAWESLDTGPAMGARELFLAQGGGEQRLFALGHDGLVRLLEEWWHGDQVVDASTPTRLRHAPVSDRLLTRGFPTGGARADRGLVAIETWHPKFSVRVVTDGQNESAPTAITERTRDRRKYRRPFNRAPWPEDNADGNHGEPYREDYAVLLPTGLVDETGGEIWDETDTAIEPGSMRLDGVALDRWQAALEPLVLPARPGQRYAQLDIRNAQGRLAVLGVAAGARAVSHWLKAGSAV